MNHLADSLSPYLLQHKDNPVDWYPWGGEAFDQAKKTDKPIFLSVGYAACHWCHVMEHESFENKTIAEFLNEHFVSIKVDREERPDIDQIYMNAVQVMTGRGGWPMSVFLNHDQKPFYAGTYWPPTERQGMPGFLQVLDAIADAWKNRRGDVVEHANDISKALVQIAIGTDDGLDDEAPDSSVIEVATDHLLSSLDKREGGFGSAPKFPHATDLMLLLRRGQITGNSALTDAAVLTLDKMACGGIRDHIGGGFARYSVDGHWLVPHFEKMLYDNSLLATCYLQAFQATGEKRHAEVAEDVLTYLCRDMVDDAGGLHCSEDADSEGVEGKFYVWKPEQIIEVLGQERGERFCQIYDITQRGNFEGNSIANLKEPIESIELQAELADDREKLRRIRDKRVHPGRDDKVLVAWNALAIKALSLGGAVLGRNDFLFAAIRAAEFVFDKMTKPDGRLLHAFRGKTAHLDAYLDDYAYLAEACVSLFETTADAKWIERAVQLAETMLEHFEDKDRGGFFYTANDSETLITRNKDWHDGSLVGANASAASAIWKLTALTDRDDFREAVKETLVSGSDVIRSQAAACAALITVLDRYHGDHEQWVIAVPDHASLESLRTELAQVFRPQRTLSWIHSDLEKTSEIIKLNDNRKMIDGKATLYRCKGFTCDAPITGHDQIVQAWRVASGA
ncbi:thioredoxin domain-containing protein [Rubripirellula amarantea]|nr:thioredoxin domain-containing protein [Rubripirellula amarantea]